ncbi:MAG: hypothetical protein WCU00_07470 [Candidatus Latescibacterota bacterium]
MKRREAVRLIPLSLAGAAGIAKEVLGQQSLGQKGPVAGQGTLGMNAPGGMQQGCGLYAQYSQKVKIKLDWIRKTQSENLLEASYAVARTVRNGGQCWSVWDTGHSTQNDQFPGRNGEPEIIFNDFNPQKAKKGDLLLANRFSGQYEVLTEKDIFVISGPAPWGGDVKGAELLVPDVEKRRLRPYSKIWIETNITSVDGEVYMPGEPAPIGPFSGILGMVEYWMILADACRVLAADGYTGKVKGDEPALGEKTAWVNQSEPLMDNYYKTVMQQIEMIGGEIGDIRKIAKAAVDAVLSGGSVYYYSRYYVGLATEALGRRSGLMLNKTISDEPKHPVKLTAKDVVIMGLSKPNDDVDLKYLDQFKASGAKIYSMGPAIRDGRIPDGRTVPKSTLLHVGRCCDTYGLFAVQGFDQKVCPTSGPVMNQVYWALQMEVAEEIIRRTGNTPGVLFSAALKGGSEHNALGQLRVQARGY